MVWWTWILLWVAVIAVSLLLLAYLGWRLFRGFTALVEEFGRAGEALTPQPENSAPETERQFVPAVFMTPADVKAANALSARNRRWSRLERRVQRRASRGQPQLLRDMPHL